MAQQMKINDEVTVGPQPTEDEIQKLGHQGFKSVVNFRAAGEYQQPLSPDAESEVVDAAGMEYLNIPVFAQSMDPDVVDRFRRRFAELPKPVFAHCKSGKRAGAMVMMHIAVEQGMSGEAALQKAKEMGFECDQPQLEQFVRHYLDSQAVSL